MFDIIQSVVANLQWQLKYSPKPLCLVPVSGLVASTKLVSFSLETDVLLVG